MEIVAETDEHFLTSIAVTDGDGMVALCAASGNLLQFNKDSRSFEVVLSTETTPTSFALDPESGSVFLSSPTDQCLLQAHVSGEGQYGHPSVMFAKYEGHSFIGPTAAAVSPLTGELFFADGGCEGDSSFTHPVGALYRTVQNRKQLVPLCTTGLQQPSAVAVGWDGCVYVCEQSANRLLRYVPRGSYYVGGVFASFQGSMGPSAVAVSPQDGTVLVALYEPNSIGDSTYVTEEEAGDVRQEGTVMVLGRDGREHGRILVPGSQICGLAIDREGKHAYVLQSDDAAYHSVVYRVPLPAG